MNVQQTREELDKLFMSCERCNTPNLLTTYLWYLSEDNYISLCWECYDLQKDFSCLELLS